MRTTWYGACLMSIATPPTILPSLSSVAFKLLPKDTIERRAKMAISTFMAEKFSLTKRLLADPSIYILAKNNQSFMKI
jgi:hypothetical protein